MHYNDDVKEIEASFQKQFKIHFSADENKYQSIAFCYSNDVHILDHEDYNAVSVFDILKPSFYKSHITVALLYCSPSFRQIAFINQLTYFITAKNVNIY